MVVIFINSLLTVSYYQLFMASALPTAVEESNVAAAPNLAAISSTARLGVKLKEVTPLITGIKRGSSNAKAIRRNIN